MLRNAQATMSYQNNKVIVGSFLLWAILCSPLALAQYGPGEEPTPAGALSERMLKDLEQGLPLTPTLRATRNALNDHSIKSMVIDQDIVNRNDSYFSHVIPNPGSITNQQQSGRCWMFAGLNLLRPKVIGKHGMKDFALSQSYGLFYQKLEAANRSLELAIALRDEPIHSRRLDTFLKHLIGDGGNWNYLRALVEKYGAVPSTVMPDSYAAAHTGEMDALLATRLRKAFIEIRTASQQGADMPRLRQVKQAALQDIYKILVLCLGQPPKNFDWRYENKDGKVTPLETYTPLSFSKKFLDSELDRYVSFVDYPGQPMHARLQWPWERTMADQPDMEAINVSTEELRSMTLASILADEPVWFAANASAEGDRKKGLWLQDIDRSGELFGIDFSMTKADELAYDNGGPSHAMLFTGVDVKGGKPAKWKVENSWGDQSGDKGWFTIGDSWFSHHVYQVIIDKRFVPADLLPILQQKPHVLPPWDPFADWQSASER
ncbi:hypothetical protein JST97_18235 [bacterium]|nr:hypothetical protein [bacterium]